MGLSEREWQVWEEIKEWEQQLHIGEQTDIINLYYLWLDNAVDALPTNTKNDFFSKLDDWLFHLHAIIQNSQLQMDARQQILTTAKIFDEDIQQIKELKRLSIDQLKYISQSQIVKHRLASIAQGGLTGTGNSLFATTDLLAMAMIQLRTIQLIAMSYSYDGKTPYELMLSLKVFYSATLPKRYQKSSWDALLEELNDMDQSYFYSGSEHITDEKWLEQLLKQIFKSLLLVFAKQRIVGRFPIVGVAIGAGMNYKLTRQVTEFAEKFYQYRFLSEKRGAGA